MGYGRNYEIMKCPICGESDESKLIMSTRLVNGKVRHTWICFRCSQIEKFKIAVEKTIGEDGNSVLSEEKVCERTEPARDLHRPSLQK